MNTGALRQQKQLHKDVTFIETYVAVANHFLRSSLLDWQEQLRLLRKHEEPFRQIMKKVPLYEKDVEICIAAIYASEEFQERRAKLTQLVVLLNRSVWVLQNQ